jgi:hypothetical protein
MLAFPELRMPCTPDAMRLWGFTFSAVAKKNFFNGARWFGRVGIFISRRKQLYLPMQRVLSQLEAIIVTLRKPASVSSGGFIVRQQNFYYRCLHKALWRGPVLPATVSGTKAQSTARTGSGQDHASENGTEGIAAQPQGKLQ